MPSLASGSLGACGFFVDPATLMKSLKEPSELAKPRSGGDFKTVDL